MNFFKKYFYLVNGLIIFIFYLTTIAPSVIQIDSGELAAVQCTLGIAHPTGYPLFTMLGHLFSLIPLPFSKIFQLNLLAAIYCAIAISIFTYTTKLILDNLNSFQFIKVVKIKSKKRKSSNNIQTSTSSLVLPETVKIISSIISGIFLAFSKTFWFQSTSVEVYSLQMLLITLIIFTLIKAFVQSDNEKTLSKHWMLFAFTLALGFTNHMTTLLIIPGAAYLYFTQNGFNKRSVIQIIFMLLIFFPILFLIYSYLPIRAAQNPSLNWGNPTDMERILRHVSGKQYQVWLFSSTAAASKQLNYFISNIPKEFSITLLLVFYGIVISFLEVKKLFIFLVIVFLSTVLYSINYDINDIDSYFLLAYISLAFFSLIGIYKLFYVAVQKGLKLFVLVFILILLASIQFYSNYAEVNQSNDFAYEDYTKAILNSVPQNSVVFSYQWDYFISESYYFQLVEHFRKDVAVIDKELLRRSWYYNQLYTNHAELLSGIKPEVDRFLEALKPFEQQGNFNANLLENSFRKIMTGLVATNIDKHNYFIAPEIVEGEMRRGEFQLPKGYILVPYSLLFKVVSNTNYVDAPLPNFKIRFTYKDDKYIAAIKSFISSMLIRRALYELQFNNTERAIIYALKVATDFPEIKLPSELQKLILN